MENPLFGILAGAVFTGLVQSSAATVGIAIAMASEGLLALPSGIALALGANIGTCVTALLAALGKPTEAVRAAVVHISFNIAGVLIWLPLLSQLADLAVMLSPEAVGLDGREKLAAEVPRQIANANTLFNVVNTLVFIGFTTWFARLAEHLVPERALPAGVIIEPEFLDESALKLPSVALENVRHEIERAGTITLDMMGALYGAFDERDKAKLERAARDDDQIDILDAEILRYLSDIRQTRLTDEESHDLEALMTAMNNLENLADIMETEIVSLAKTYIDRGLAAASDETQAMVEGLWQGVRKALALSVQAVGQSDQRAAQDVILMKDEIRDLADALFERHAKRLRPDDPTYLERVRMLMTFIEQLRHIYTLAKRVARTQLPAQIANAWVRQRRSDTGGPSGHGPKNGASMIANCTWEAGKSSSRTRSRVCRKIA